MIIGLTGKSGAGKDTAAAYLVREHGFVRIAFADKLKEAAQRIFGFNYNQLHGDDKDKVDAFWGMTPGAVLQRLGTVGVRNAFSDTPIGEDIWIKAATRDMIPGQNYVFTDVRFPNEAKAVKDAGGTIYRVTRLGHVSKRAPHISEMAMDDYPCLEIRNSGTHDDLRAEVKRCLGL